MRIGLLGPVATADLAASLDGGAGLPAGQAGSPVTLLAVELLRLGHEVRIWSLDDGIDAPVHAEGPGLSISYLPKRSGGRGRDAYAAEVRWLRQALAQGTDVDVLNAHWSYEFALAALGRPEPVVVTVHDWAPTILRYSFDPYRLARLTMFARTHLRRPPMTTPSPYLQRLLRRWGLGTATVVPNGVPVDAFANGPRSRGDGCRLVAVARGFDRRKNTATLLRAHAVLRRDLDAHLTIFGAAHEPDGPAAVWARTHGLADGVSFAGEVPYAQVRQAMASADLFLHPAREESFGMVLVEAMAQGTPVVAGRDSGAVPWVCADGAGVLVDVESPEAIAGAAHDLLADTAAWEAQGAAGLASARRRFGMDAVAGGYLRVYEEHAA